MNLKSISGIATILSTAGFLVAGAPAHAAIQTESTSVMVNYSDLDLSRESGVRVLLQRISVAADAACGTAPDIREMQAHERYVNCKQAAKDKAVAAAHAPLVARLYTTKPGSEPMQAAALPDR